ncbi:MAG: TolC family protein [Bacteroidales bacterium]|jgi:outer membrane protein TolC|nr:TolC family protein [Bacteroidales bacterium]
MRKIITILSFLLLAPGLFAQDRELGLSDAISLALENNFGLRISRAEADIAGINNNWANAGRMPSIGFTLSGNNNYNISDDLLSSNINAGLGLRWTIFDGFRVNLTKDRLTQLERLSEGRTAVLIENTIEDVILGYYNVLLQQELLKVLSTVMSLSEDRYEYERTRQEIGNSVTYNVLQAKNNYLSDKAAFMNQEVNYRNAIRNLDFIMGEDSQETWIFTEEFMADTVDYVLSDLLDRMMADNSVLRNQYINIMLSKNSTGLARSSYYPSLSLSAGLDNRNTLSPSAGSGSSFSTYGNITLSYDIYQGGLRDRALEVARINESIAGIEEEELKKSLSNQLLSLFDRYEVQKELLYIAGENLEAAEMNVQISGDKFRSGAINSFNYRDIQLIYLNAAYQQIQDVYNLIATGAALTRLTGGFINYSE